MVYEVINTGSTGYQIFYKNCLGHCNRPETNNSYLLYLLKN